MSGLSFVFVVIICLQEFLKTFSRCLQTSLNRFAKRCMSSRRPQDKRLQDVFQRSFQELLKPFTSRLDQDSYIGFVHRSSEVIKTIISTLVIRLQDFFKTFSKSFAKTSSRRIKNVFRMSCKDVQICYRLKLFLLTHLQDIIKTYSTCFLYMLSR